MAKAFGTKVHLEGDTSSDRVAISFLPFGGQFLMKIYEKKTANLNQRNSDSKRGISVFLAFL